jgi:D-aspartate ligase
MVRALAARNVPTAVVCTKPYDFAHRSRWVAAHDAVSGREEEPERLVELLERRARDWPGWALLPSNDEALAALSQHRERLSSVYRVIAPGWEVAHCFLDKRRMLEIAREVGVEAPRCYGPAVAGTAGRPGLRFPVVVKPVEGYRFTARFGTKLLRADDRIALERCIAKVVEADLPCEVFDLVPGGDDRIYAYCVYMGARGEPVAGLAIRKLRQSPPLFGVARVAEIAAEHPELREATIAILRRMGFRGIAAAEFKLDPRDGRMRFLEVNGRSVIYNGLLRRAGLDGTGLAWSDHVEGGVQPFRPEGWPGVWIHLHADLLQSALGRRHHPIALADFLAPYRRPKEWAVWSAADPLPFAAEWGRTAAEGAAALQRGRLGRTVADRARAAGG